MIAQVCPGKSAAKRARHNFDGITIGMVALLGLGSVAVADDQRFDFTPIDQYLEDLVSDHDLPGCSLRIVQDGEVIYEHAVDYSLDRVVPTASAAKWISAAAVMAVVDQGFLDLDDTTNRWLGWTGDKGTITLRQLMAHVSGIDGAASPCLGDPGTSLADCVDEIQAMPLIGPPGGQFRYGGNSMQVAGRMCEVATGDRPFVDLFNDFVGGPLAMAQTAYTSDTNPRLAGGATTSLRDYSHLIEMWLGGGALDDVRVLSESAVMVALSDQTAGAPPQALPPCVQAYHGYGIGNWIWEIAGDGQPRENASPGAFRLTPWIDHSRNLAATFLTATTEDICDEIEVLKQLVRDTVDGPVVGVPVPTIGATGVRLGPIRPYAAGGCTIEFALPTTGQVRIMVVDLAGRQIATLEAGRFAEGGHATSWNGRTRAGRSAPSGIYLVTMEACGARLSSKALFVR